MFQGAAEVSTEPDGFTVQAVLCFEIRVLGNYTEAVRNRPLIQVRVHTATEIGGDELVRSLVLINDLRLPSEVIGHDVMLKVFPFQLVARIEDAIARREVLPFIYKLAPVDQAPDLIDRLRCLVFLL